MRIPFEDRTDETTEERLARRVANAGQFLMMAAIQVSDSTPAVGVGGLALALGQGAARSGADLDEVLEAVRAHYEEAAAAMATETPKGENLN
jgi:hypothetical protein